MSKEKGKSHPFARHLRETEDVLWMSAQANRISLQQALRKGIGLDIGATIFIILMIAMRGYFADYDIMAVIGIAFITLFLCSPVAAVMLFFIVRTQNHTRQIYAVTSERLLYRVEQNVKTIALKDIPAISVFQSDTTKGALSFGPKFPMWSDVENAAAVKQIIEDARAERMQSANL